MLGSDLNPSDASLVLFGGELTQAPGAQVTGQTEPFEGVNWAAPSAPGRTGWIPWFGFSFIGWLVQTAFCLVLALVVAALMPRQLRTVQRNVAAGRGRRSAGARWCSSSSRRSRSSCS